LSDAAGRIRTCEPLRERMNPVKELSLTLEIGILKKQR